MEANYPKAYKEVYEILKYVPKEDYEKISEDIIKTIEFAMDRNYEYTVNEYIDFDEQPMLEETKAILAIIYRDFWATEEQKIAIKRMHNADIQKSEEEKSKLYKYEDIFKTNENINSNISQIETGEELIEYKENWYIKFLNFIKEKFKK